MLEVFFSSFLLILVAELGDKTHLFTFNIGMHFSKKLSFFAISLAIFFVMAIGCLFGSSLNYFFNQNIIKIIIFFVFVITGILFISGKEIINKKSKEKYNFWGIFTGFSIAEMGDKSQLVVFGLSAKYHNFLLVWVGASFAELLVNSISLFAGSFLKNKINQKLLSFMTGVFFIIFSLLIFLEK